MEKVKKRKASLPQDKSVIIARNASRIFLVIWTVLIIFPVLWTFMTSLKTPGEFMANAWAFPSKPQWSNYKEAWEKADFAKYFSNSLILSAGTVLLTVVMTSTSAYIVGKFVSPVIKSIEIFYSIFMMVPQMLLLVPLLQFCKKLNMVSGGQVIFTLMLTNALQGVPFYVFMLTPFMRGLNNAIFEAAEIDGANQFQIFAKLVLPMIIPAVLMVGLLSFVGIWNEYVMSITFIKKSQYYTLSVGINSLMNDANVRYPVRFAALVLAMVPILIVYAIFQKPLQDGLSSSDGVKG